jgi:hypothetical protein
MHNAASVAVSFDNVVGDREQQLVGDGEPECFGRFAVDHKFRTVVKWGLALTSPDSVPERRCWRQIRF